MAVEPILQIFPRMNRIRSNNPTIRRDRAWSPMHCKLFLERRYSIPGMSFEYGCGGGEIPRVNNLSMFEEGINYTVDSG